MGATVYGGRENCNPCGPFRLQPSDDGSLASTSEAGFVGIVIDPVIYANEYKFYLEYRTGSTTSGYILIFAARVLENSYSGGYVDKTYLVDATPETTSSSDSGYGDA